MKKLRIVLLAVAVIVGGFFVLPVHAQNWIVQNGVSILNGSMTVNGNFTVTGSCTGCGGGGAIGANTQVAFNDAGVESGNANLVFDKAGPKLTVPSTASSMGFNVSTGANFTGMSSANGSTSLLFVVNSGKAFNLTGSTISARNDGQYLWDSTTNPETFTPDTGFSRTAAGVVEINNGTGGTTRDLKLRMIRSSQATPPTCSASCGTSPSVAGSDTAMIVTMGATGTPASPFTVTFNTTWAAAPSCVGASALSTMVVGKMPIALQTSTTTITVTTNGTAPATSDKYAFHCIGVQ